MTRVAAVLVTSNSQRWIATTLSSVLNQSRPADRIVVVDDASTDETLVLIDRMTDGSATVVPSTADSNSRTTRIAHNFRQGLQEARDCEVAVLGDHDDIWHAHRIGHQVGLLEVLQQDAMVASDGRLVDANGVAIGGTLRSAFPIGVDWNPATPGERMRAVLRRSVATGGASAVRPEAFADVEIPSGWLHDRWWSLLATAQERMNVDDTTVIDYRVTAEQQVGLDSGHQARTPVSRVFVGAQNLGETIVKLNDLAGLSRSATEAVRPELSRTRLFRTML
jgi:glycosyltransferase involved in cell wall biosynthesis